MKIVHKKIVDTSVLYPKTLGYKYSLKNLAYNYLKLDIQKGIHDSREDAKIALALAKLKTTILCNIGNQKIKSTFDCINDFSFKNLVQIIDTKDNISDFGISNIQQKISKDVIDTYDQIEVFIKENLNL